MAARAECPVADVSNLLIEGTHPDRASLQRLTPLIYDELRRVARSRMRRERPNHTLQVTGLIHEAYLRLVGQDTVWESRTHFLAIASEIMRRLLLDYAKRKLASKRGAGAMLASFSDSIAPVVRLDANLLLVDEAITKLKGFDAQAAKVVEMRFFGGLTNDEIAAALAISTATVQRRWMVAKAWLYREMRPAAQA